METIKRFSYDIIRIVATDAGVRFVATAIILLLGGPAVFWQGTREISVGAASALMVVVALNALGRWYTIRFFPYAIRRRRHTFEATDFGRQVTYEVRLLVRSRQQLLREFSMRMKWSGEASLTDPCNFEKVGIGFDVRVFPQQDAHGCPTGWAMVKFTFTEPIRKWRSREVAIKFHLNEPHRSYYPYWTYDTSSHAHTLFASLSVIFRWDDTSPFQETSFNVGEYRNSIVKEVHGQPPLKKWDFRQLIGKDSHEASWSVRPIPLSRYYEMCTALRPHEGPIKPRSIELPKTDADRAQINTTGAVNIEGEC